MSPDNARDLLRRAQTMAAALLATPLLGFQLRGTVPRHRVAAASVQMQQLATDGDLELPVPSTFLDNHKHNLNRNHSHSHGHGHGSRPWP